MWWRCQSYTCDAQTSHGRDADVELKRRQTEGLSIHSNDNRDTRSYIEFIMKCQKTYPRLRWNKKVLTQGQPTGFFLSFQPHLTVFIRKKSLLSCGDGSVVIMWPKYGTSVTWYIWTLSLKHAISMTTEQILCADEYHATWLNALKKMWAFTMQGGSKERFWKVALCKAQNPAFLDLF